MALSPKRFLLILGAIFLVVFGGVGALLLYVFSLGPGDNPVANEALARAQRNEAVVAKLGSPLKLGLGGSTMVGRVGDNEKALWAGPIEGPKGRATLRAEGFKQADAWEFMLMEVELDGERVDLLAPARPAP